MSAALARAVMALAAHILGPTRGEWAAAMRAEFDAVAVEGDPLPFALGCLATAVRELPRHEDGCLTLASYGLALGVMLPLAALQIGCALFELPYLYPGDAGVVGALLEGREHERLVRSIYQAAVPSLLLLVLALGLIQVRIAWAVLDRDWTRATRLGIGAVAAAVTLVLLMAVLFLDGSQALAQGAALAVELATIVVAARWHSRFARTGGADLST